MENIISNSMSKGNSENPTKSRKLDYLNAESKSPSGSNHKNPFSSLKPADLQELLESGESVENLMKNFSETLAEADLIHKKKQEEKRKATEEDITKARKGFTMAFLKYIEALGFDKSLLEEAFDETLYYSDLLDITEKAIVEDFEPPIKEVLKLFKDVNLQAMALKNKDKNTNVEDIANLFINLFK